MTVAYLAGPIDLVGPDGQTWKQVLSKHLKQLRGDGRQITTYDPAAPFGLFDDFQHQDRRSRFIETVNYTALLSSDIFVGMITNSKASVGVPIELDIAHRRRMPIVMLTDIPYTKSVYLRNRVQERRYVYQATHNLDIWMAIAASIITAVAHDINDAPQGMTETSPDKVMRKSDIRKSTEG